MLRSLVGLYMRIRDGYEIWHKIQFNAVQADYSWKRSAKEYEALYERLTAK